MQDNLGCHGSPYWEIYPFGVQKNTFRCDMEDTNELINSIELALGNNRTFLTKL